MKLGLIIYKGLLDRTAFTESDFKILDRGNKFLVLNHLLGCVAVLFYEVISTLTTMKLDEILLKVT